MLLNNLNRIDRKKLKEVVEAILNGKNPVDFVKEKKYLIEEINIKEVEEIIRRVINREQKAVNEYKKGNKKVINYLIGKVLENLKKDRCKIS